MPTTSGENGKMAQDRLQDLVDAQDQYIQLLEKEIDDTAGWVYNWLTGESMRKRIAELRRELGLTEN